MDQQRDRIISREELQALLQAGEPVSYFAGPGTGSVIGRVLTPEEVEKGQREFSEKFYPDFRSKDLPPLPGQTR